jgi:hypothetical protein
LLYRRQRKGIQRWEEQGRGKDESLRGAEVLSGGVVLDEHGLDAVALHLEYGDAATCYL